MPPTHTAPRVDMVPTAANRYPALTRSTHSAPPNVHASGHGDGFELFVRWPILPEQQRTPTWEVSAFLCSFGSVDSGSVLGELRRLFPHLPQRDDGEAQAQPPGIHGAIAPGFGVVEEPVRHVIAEVGTFLLGQ